MEGGGKREEKAKKAKRRVQLHLWVTLAACGVEVKLPGTFFFWSVVLIWLCYRASLGDWAENRSLCTAGAVLVSIYNLVSVGKPRVFIKMKMKLFLGGT